jgi:peroxiredoxin (alkyl hydroperoxide reductase subunit C)
MWAKRISVFLLLILLLIPYGTLLAGQSPTSDESSIRMGTEVGDLAPEFTMKDQTGKEVSLRDFRGKKNVVLVFYVFAFSEACGFQLLNFQRSLNQFESADTQVLGVSMDSRFANHAFAQQLGISFPLLSDWGGRVTRLFGVFNETYGAARRAALLIDKSGKVVEIRFDKSALDATPLVVAAVARNSKR